MTAEILRKAASLMRERAEAATPGPWTFDQEAVTAHGETFVVVNAAAPDSDENDPDVEHIASWHPAVALAVADWLDSVATWLDREAEWLGEPAPADGPALAVATAYLGDPS